MIKSENLAFLSSLGGGVFIVLAICFSFAIEASAHDYERSDGQHTYTHSEDINVSAEMVEDAPDAEKEALTRKFLLHAAKHIELILQDTGLDEDRKLEKATESLIFIQRTREPGVFKNGSAYLIVITQRGTMINHGLYQDLYGNGYDLQMEPARTLASAGNISEDADPVCTSYTYKDDDRTACAINLTSSAGVRTLIAGFDHAENILMPPDCSGLTLPVTAKRVEEETDLDMKRNLLKQYVQGVIAAMTRLQSSVALEAVRSGINPATPQFQNEVSTRIYEKIGCFRNKPDFFYGSIYAFVMDPVRGVSFLNGLDFDLHGLSVSLTDPNPIGDEPNILVAFQKALTDGNTGNVPDDLEHGNNAFVKYHWDNPLIAGDEVEDFLAKGVVPGTSVKESYIEVVNTSRRNPAAPPNYFIFGSGIYPDMEEADDDDGCSIAASGSTHQGTLLNLLLVASVLFSVVFLRKRV